MVGHNPRFDPKPTEKESIEDYELWLRSQDIPEEEIQQLVAAERAKDEAELGK